MSASTTPTFRPRAAMATATFTVTEDLPTPPLPEATAYTRVSDPGRANGTSRTGSSPRSLVCRSRRCCSLITSSSTVTPVTPATGLTAAVTSAVILSRSGQPDTVRKTPTCTAPLGEMSTDLTMPSSVIGRWISGSDTAARAAVSDPEIHRPITELGMVKSVDICVLSGRTGESTGPRHATCLARDCWTAAAIVSGSYGVTSQPSAPASMAAVCAHSGLPAASSSRAYRLVRTSVRSTRMSSAPARSGKVSQTSAPAKCSTATACRADSAPGSRCSSTALSMASASTAPSASSAPTRRSRGRTGPESGLRLARGGAGCWHHGQIFQSTSIGRRQRAQCPDVTTVAHHGQATMSGASVRWHVVQRVAAVASIWVTRSTSSKVVSPRLAAASRGDTTFDEVLRVTHIDATAATRCTTCQRTLAPDMVACPWCATVVTSGHCARCRRPIDVDWKICPWCQQPAPPRAKRNPDSGPVRPRLLLVGADDALGAVLAEAMDGVVELHREPGAESALHAVAVEHFAGALVCDTLPDLAGAELIRVLRTDVRTNRYALLLLSAGSPECAQAAAIVAGADGWLVTPYDPETVAAAVQQSLARHVA